MPVTKAGIVMSDDDKTWLINLLNVWETKIDTRLTQHEARIDKKIDALPCVEQGKAIVQIKQRLDNGDEYRKERRRETGLSLKWVLVLIGASQAITAVIVLFANR